MLDCSKNAGNSELGGPACSRPWRFGTPAQSEHAKVSKGGFDLGPAKSPEHGFFYVKVREYGYGFARKLTGDARVLHGSCTGTGFAGSAEHGCFQSPN